METKLLLYLWIQELFPRPKGQGLVVLKNKRTNEQKKIMREIVILRDKYFKSEKVTPRNKVVIIGGSLKPNIFEFY